MAKTATSRKAETKAKPAAANGSKTTTKNGNVDFAIVELAFLGGRNKLTDQDVLTLVTYE